MLEAMAAGQRDARALAQLARGTTRGKISRLEEALDCSFFTGEHAAVLDQGEMVTPGPRPGRETQGQQRYRPRQPLAVRPPPLTRRRSLPQSPADV
jgi:hypothetical protein